MARAWAVSASPGVGTLVTSTQVGDGVAVTRLGGVAVGVPVVSATAVARASKYWAVAAFCGTGVLVTTTQPAGVAVTRLRGVGVAVPVDVASAVILATTAAAVSTFSGVGVLVTTTYSRGGGMAGGTPTLTNNIGFSPCVSGP